MRMALVSRSAGRSMQSHGSAGAFHWVCSRTALHSASSSGHTETAMALIEAGADVHCKTNDGYVAGLPRELDARVVGSLAVLEEWSMQSYGAAPCILERPHGDGDGAGQGGRGRALHGQPRVRFRAALWGSLSFCSSRTARRGQRSTQSVVLHAFFDWLQIHCTALGGCKRSHGDCEGADWCGCGRALQGEQDMYLPMSC